MTPKPLHLVGCGILAREVEFLIRKNGWDVRTDFLESSLHINLGQLQQQLTGALERHRDERPIVFYGCCHPLMERFLEQAATFRTEGQNCVEMLLGRQRFMAELEQGAYFLLEDWARHWDSVMHQSFGDHPQVARAIFHEDRRYLLAIRTPVSHDFTEAAEHAAASVDLPLRWMDASLEHLERVLQAAVDRRRREGSPP
ncbi:MAG: DUF1638 domain-containing protein [Methylococcaceae bacterium]|nr:DUF1638 domain-containing protein [Methylococcaceae bacterium]